MLMQPKRVEPLGPIEQLVEGHRFLGTEFFHYSVVPPRPDTNDLTRIRLAIAARGDWDHAKLMEQTYYKRIGIEVKDSDTEKQTNHKRNGAEVEEPSAEIVLQTKLSQKEIDEIMTQLKIKKREIGEAMKPETKNPQKDETAIQLEIRKQLELRSRRN